MLDNNIKQHNVRSEVLSFRNIIIAIVLILIAFFTFSKYSQIKKDAEPVVVNINSEDHTIGRPDAKVSIIEFADMQCPACKAFDPIVSQVIADYVSKNSSVKFTFKHFPLVAIHQNTMLAAIGGEAAAKQSKFWEYKKVVYEKQEEWASSLNAKDKIRSYLASVGIDAVKWDQDLSDKSLENKVLSDLKEAMSLNLGGTPSFIINGVKVDASYISTVEKLKAYIDAELAK